MNKLIHPGYYLIVKREGTSWHFQVGNVFHNPRNVPALPLHERLHSFGETLASISVELFRINGGKPGYYLTNLRDKTYHYCGVNWDDVKATLLSLGIGRKDPIDAG